MVLPVVPSASPYIDAFHHSIKETPANHANWGPKENQSNSHRAQWPTASVPWIQVGLFSFRISNKFLGISTYCQIKRLRVRETRSGVKAARTIFCCCKEWERLSTGHFTQGGERRCERRWKSDFADSRSKWSFHWRIAFQSSFLSGAAGGILFVLKGGFPQIGIFVKRLISSNNLKPETVDSALPLEQVNFPQWTRHFPQCTRHSLRFHKLDLQCEQDGTPCGWISLENHLRDHQVENASPCYLIENSRFPLNWKDHKLVESITTKFNNQLVHDPESPVMCYALRDPVSVGTFPSPQEGRSRGKAKVVKVKSKCFDACLVIDGSLSYKFNDGTKAIIELLDEDALRTVQLCSL